MPKYILIELEKYKLYLVTIKKIELKMEENLK